MPESSYKFTSTESPISSLLHRHFDLNNSFNNNNPTNLQESSNSEAPQAFLSLSPQLPQSQQNTPRLDHLKTVHYQQTEYIDEAQKLMQLLGLENNSQVEKERDDLDKCC